MLDVTFLLVIELLFVPNFSFSFPQDGEEYVKKRINKLVDVSKLYFVDKETSHDSRCLANSILLSKGKW